MANTALTAEESRELFDPPDELARKLAKLAKWFRASRHAIAFTGAGISTSAGVPDFRSGMGTCLATGPGAWELRAHGATRPASARTTSTQKAIPTRTHRSLVALHAHGRLAHLVSQNTDGLHRRSGMPPAALSELHGNSNLEICARCGCEFLRDFKVRAKQLSALKHETGRACEYCGGALHDSIINFGESLPAKALADAFDHGTRADLCLSLGSSLRVTPAADVPALAARPGARLVIVNLQQTPLDARADLVIRAKTDDVMSALFDALALPTPPPFRLRRALVVGTRRCGGGSDEGTAAAVQEGAATAHAATAEEVAAAVKGAAVVHAATVDKSAAASEPIAGATPPIEEFEKEGGKEGSGLFEVFVHGVEPDLAALGLLTAAASSPSASPRAAATAASEAPVRPYQLARRLAVTLPAGASPAEVAGDADGDIANRVMAIKQQALALKKSGRVQEALALMRQAKTLELAPSSPSPPPPPPPRINARGAFVVDGGAHARVALRARGLGVGSTVGLRVVPFGHYGEPPIELQHTVLLADGPDGGAAPAAEEGGGGGVPSGAAAAAPALSAALHVLEYDPLTSHDGCWKTVASVPCSPALLARIGARCDGHRRDDGGDGGSGADTEETTTVATTPAA